MCGRFTLRATPAQLAEIFAVLRSADLTPRYNIAPTQTVAAIRATGPEHARELVLLRWGLIPSWAKDARIGSSLINARSDTAASKPSFRSAFRKRRCLIPVDGFYEWQSLPGKKTKQPLFIGMKSGVVFAFAGLWEHWIDPEGTPLETCTILTTEANALLAPFHDRMPVILDPADYDRWLDPTIQDPAQVQPLLVPYPAERMQVVPVSTLVNSPKNDVPECLTAVKMSVG
jgi:putative SOS response-associated peptidase YedK